MLGARRRASFYFVRAVAVLVLLCVSCEAYVGTDGHRYAKDPSHSSRNVWKDALIASAAHDFGCEVRDVHAVRNYESGDPLVREPPLGSTAPTTR